MPDGRSVSAVSLGTLVRICAVLHSVPPERIPALKGRFSNFLKIGFPDVKAVGTGSRAEYWPEHVSQLLVAFELLRFRMPQTAAAKAVTGSIDVVLEAVARAARRLPTEDASSHVLLSVTSNALVEDAKRADLADVAIAVAGSVGRGEGASTAMIVDVTDLVARAVAAASTTDEPFGAAFFAAADRRKAG